MQWTQDWLTARVQATPNALALQFSGQQWTYAQLDDLAKRWGEWLTQNGIQTGQFVAVLMPNNPHYVALVHAIARLGTVLLPLNARLTADELTYQLKLTNCQWLISDKPQPLPVTVLTVDAYLASSVAQQKTSFPQPSALFREQDVQAVVFTSGTTGHPKGVELTFGNHFTSAVGSALRLGLQASDNWLSVLPLYHVGGLAVVWRSCLYGTAVTLHPRFHLPDIIETLQTEPISLISLVPTMLYRLLQSDVQWSESLRLILLGGAAALPQLLEQALAQGLPIATTYGLTEASSQVATMPPSGVREKRGSVGRPLFGTAMQIRDEAGQTVPSGQYGVVWVRGGTVMRGYYANPEATAQVLQDGWLCTGDIGFVDAEGDLWLVQRRSDLIVTGGENVYPSEVERVLLDHTQVKAVCVVGVPHPEWGQQVTAMLVVDAVSEAELMAYARDHLAGYKQPRQLRFVADLPKTASGKIARKQVQEMMSQ